MAEKPQPPHVEPAAEIPAAPTGRSLLARSVVVLFVGVVIVVECLVAYLYMPSVAETAGATTHPAAEPKPLEPEPEKAEPAEGAEQAEVDLGEFSVTSFQPVSNTTLRIDFRLYGTVRQADQKDFARLMEENKHRFRDQVIVTMRSAEIRDLTDAGLGLIKRKILDRTNRTFGKPVLQSVIVSDFSFIEQ